ncbi:xanthine dehydrogenase family protein subunit M [Oleomonas cavernae]|uniref:Xanthine dehydrogenase family protein subunit M n=1 Tax=Oleomonas cavernae TaxID=2320859 RepID=A0A418WIL3_9PROT|nr:xanthine dehydrogenase family protein subunit M [Oleomonas cavernae]RJF89820.1 xanthine dehydrogenase family protein subunit M [Oleomonas cavernae]
MIPGSFQYYRPASVTDAVKLLADLGDDARPLAGGHSLIPMMKLRMANPEHLVDLGGIADLKGIRQAGGRIEIGAMTTQAELIASDLLGQAAPIIKETSLLIADPQVRYCGTLGGNVANGDPGNDMPAVMMALDARYHVIGAAGTREIAARSFYQGAYYTALEPGEMVTAISFAPPPAGHGCAYEKLKRKIGDYATAAAAVILTLAGGKVSHCAITLTNVSETPLLAEAAARHVIGSRLEPDVLARAVAAAEAITDPATDGRGPAVYRTKMAGIMVRRALERAAARAAA